MDNIDIILESKEKGPLFFFSVFFPSASKQLFILFYKELHVECLRGK